MARTDGAVSAAWGRHLPDSGIIHAQIITDFLHNCKSGGEPDTHLQDEVTLNLKFLAVPPPQEASAQARASTGYPSSRLTTVKRGVPWE
jgi:hypothetical protein